MTLVFLPLLVCVLGLVIFLVAGRGERPSADWKDIGRIMFWCGLLAFLLLTPTGALSARL